MIGTVSPFIKPGIFSAEIIQNQHLTPCEVHKYRNQEIICFHLIYDCKLQVIYLQCIIMENAHYYGQMYICIKGR